MEEGVEEGQGRGGQGEGKPRKPITINPLQRREISKDSALVLTSICRIFESTISSVVEMCNM